MFELEIKNVCTDKWKETIQNLLLPFMIWILSDNSTIDCVYYEGPMSSEIISQTILFELQSTLSLHIHCPATVQFTRTLSMDNSSETKVWIATVLLFQCTVDIDSRGYKTYTKWQRPASKNI